jgi:YD repeat-containing protein
VSHSLAEFYIDECRDDVRAREWLGKLKTHLLEKSDSEPILNRPICCCLARTTTRTRDSNNLVTRVTDGLGRHTDSMYDTVGNVTSVTRLASTGNAVAMSYTYDATFNLLTSVTNPLNHMTTFVQ